MSYRSAPRFKPFTITVDTTLPGSPSDTFILPLEQASPGNIRNYRFRVEWGDGTISRIQSWNSPDLTHVYPSDGIYEVKIYGLIDNIYFANTGDKSKIININQWGSVIWRDLGSSFYGCDNLTNYGATDVPILINTKINLVGVLEKKFINLGSMFSNSSFNSNINNWDVSNVSDTVNMFYNTTFNQPLSGWNVGNVTNMQSMFAGSFGSQTQFNQPIGNWNVSKVTNMSSMFEYSLFNQSIGNWNVSGVTNMAYMFNNATSFNQPLIGWNVGNVTDMTWMFLGATSFNQPLSGWNVSNVTNMQSMFYNTPFNQSIGNWNVSGVTDMSNMFAGLNFSPFTLHPFNQDLSNWNIGSVTNMSQMFSQNTGLTTTNYNRILTGWTGWDGVTATKPVQSNVTFSAGSAKYSTGFTNVVSARTYLDITKAWTITDGGGI